MKSEPFLNECHSYPVYQTSASLAVLTQCTSLELKLFHFRCLLEKLLISSLSCPSNSSGEVQYFCLVSVPVPSPSVHGLYSQPSQHLQCPFALQLPVPINTCTGFSCRAAKISNFLHPLCFCFTTFFYEGHMTLCCFGITQTLSELCLLLLCL